MGRIWAERNMVIKVAGLFTVIGFGLRLMSYRSLHDLIERTSTSGGRPSSLGEPQRKRIIRIVSAMGRRLLGDRPCLIQALALMWLLRRRGEEAQVLIGVKKDATGAFAAHAWVEQDGRVIIGGRKSPFQYRRLEND